MSQNHTHRVIIALSLFLFCLPLSWASANEEKPSEEVRQAMEEIRESAQDEPWVEVFSHQQADLLVLIFLKDNQILNYTEFFGNLALSSQSPLTGISYSSTKRKNREQPKVNLDGYHYVRDEKGNPIKAGSIHAIEGGIKEGDTMNIEIIHEEKEGSQIVLFADSIDLSAE